MATDSILKRGFKAQAERSMVKYREALHIHPCGALCAFELAKYLDVHICSALEFFPELKATDSLSCEWSALTLVAQSGNRIIIYNPFHTEARKQSDVMHELAHIICKHTREQKQYEFQIPFGMHEYNDTQEEEAKCLGATLQLPQPSLLWASKNNMSNKEIASYFNASEEMVQYRINLTGINKRKRQWSKN